MLVARLLTALAAITAADVVAAAAAAAATAAAAGSGSSAAALVLCAPPLGASAPLLGRSDASAATAGGLRAVVMVGASLNALWDKSCGTHGHAACSDGGLGFPLSAAGDFSAAFQTAPGDLNVKYVVALVVSNATAAAGFADPKNGPLPPALVAAALAQATLARVANVSAGPLCSALEPVTPAATPAVTPVMTPATTQMPMPQDSVASGASASAISSASASVSALPSSPALRAASSGVASAAAASVLLGALTLVLGAFLAL